MTAPHIPPDNHKVAVTRGRSLGQGVGIEKICESGRCEEQDPPPPLRGGGGKSCPSQAPSKDRYLKVGCLGTTAGCLAGL